VARESCIALSKSEIAAFLHLCLDEDLQVGEQNERDLQVQEIGGVVSGTSHCAQED